MERVESREGLDEQEVDASSSEEVDASEEEGGRWYCQKCKEEEPAGPRRGTSSTYIGFCKKHPKKNGCSVVLMGQDGVVLAKDRIEAMKKGIISPVGVRKETVTGKEQDVTLIDGSKSRMPRINEPLLKGFFRTTTVELDLDVLEYYRAMIRVGLITEHVPLRECITAAMSGMLRIAGYEIGVVRVEV